MGKGHGGHLTTEIIVLKLREVEKDLKGGSTPR